MGRRRMRCLPKNSAKRRRARLTRIHESFARQTQFPLAWRRHGHCCRGLRPALGLGAIPAPAAKDEVESKLDGFTAAYMKAMNAPGMTQALTDTKATIRTAGYGYANVDLKTPVSPDLLFQIGSITKSFTALIMLQLRDEGKVDLHRPVLEYLPWLPVYAVRAHHRASSAHAQLRSSRCFRHLSERPGCAACARLCSRRSLSLLQPGLRHSGPDD